MPSPEHEDVVAMLAGGLGLLDLPLADQRAMMEATASLAPLPDDVRVESVDADGVPADLVSVEGTDPSRVILYLHGGAYVLGSRASSRGLASRIARASGARVLLPEYRLAPEYPFPAALEDATACWRCRSL